MTVENKGLGWDVPVTVSEGSSSNIVLFDGAVKDNDGKTVAEVFELSCWLSADANGASDNVASSGNFTIQSSKGVLEYPLSATTSNHIIIRTLADGTFGLQITDTSPETTAYLCIRIPGSDRVSITKFVSTDFAS